MGTSIGAGVVLVYPVSSVLLSAARSWESYLDETNIGALLAEALAADVQAVLADQTSRVRADAAVSTVLADAWGI